MKIEIQLHTANTPIVYPEAESTYTKDGFFCVSFENDKGRFADKYPIGTIFRIREEYPKVSRGKPARK